MSTFVKRQGPIVALFIVAIILIAAYYIPRATVPAIKTLEDEMNAWGILLSNFLYFVGAVALFLFNFSRIRRRSSGWFFNVWTIVMMLFFIILGTTMGPTFDLYQKLYTNIVQPITATMWLVMALFMIVAAYTAFKFRSLGASLMIISTVLVMLKNAPIGEAIWPGFGPLGQWISDYPVTAGTRAFVITAAIGALLLGFRTLFGYETTIFRRE